MLKNFISNVKIMKKVLCSVMKSASMGLPMKSGESDCVVFSFPMSIQSPGVEYILLKKLWKRMFGCLLLRLVAMNGYSQLHSFLVLNLDLIKTIGTMFFFGAPFGYECLELDKLLEKITLEILDFTSVS